MTLQDLLSLGDVPLLVLIAWFLWQQRIVTEKRERYWRDPQKVISQVKKYRTKNRDTILLKKKKEFLTHRISVLTYYTKGTPNCKNCGEMLPKD